MARITCSDLGFACGQLLQHESDEELITLARDHAKHEHGEEVEDDRLRAAVQRDDD
jgi:predicted small metal-binding protein